ncbi:MAG: DUF2442 domain-containing protein [Patescibacteria group bacterium]|nr:DUF2442 domain-containing protein [Patescibacteria group bacterium]
MIHDVVSAEYRGEYRIEVAFDDGKRGIVDFSGYAERGGVFARFRDSAFFRSFHINSETNLLLRDEPLDRRAATGRIRVRWRGARIAPPRGPGVMRRSTETQMGISRHTVSQLPLAPAAGQLVPSEWEASVWKAS